MSSIIIDVKEFTDSESVSQRRDKLNALLRGTKDIVLQFDNYVEVLEFVKRIYHEFEEKAMIQFSTMPTELTEADVGKTVQYVGPSTPKYTNGYFYQVVSIADIYTWVQVEVQPTFGEGRGWDVPASAKTVLLSILRAGTYTSNQKSNIDALESILFNGIVFTQEGTNLIAEHARPIYSITQEGTTLICN